MYGYTQEVTKGRHHTRDLSANLNKTKVADESLKLNIGQRYW